MNVIVNVILAIQILTALAMIGLILIQHGKGADMGAAFGSGSSGSLFGASGSANFLSRTTGVLAAVFFVTTLALAYFSNARPVTAGSVLEQPAVVAPSSAIPGNDPAAVNKNDLPNAAVPAPVAPAAPAAAPAEPAAAPAPAAEVPANK